MRPRKSEQDSPPAESSPTPAAPPVRLVGNLSSMVVRPSDSGGGGGIGATEFESVEVDNRRQSPPLRRRDSPSMEILRRRHSPMGMDLGRSRDYPPEFRRRDSPIGFRRRDSPPGFYRRSPPPFRPRSQRFHDNPV